MSKRASKVEKFDKIKSEPGELCWLPIQDLYVDYDYQRSHEKVNGIASGWSWDIVGCLHVAVRDNKYWVIDGGHRLQAAKLRGDIGELPCYVGYFETSQEEEAEDFVSINTLRRAMSPLQKMKAGIVAKNQMYLDIDYYCRKNGFVPGVDIRAIGGLVTIWKRHGKYVLDDALYLLEKGVKRHRTFMQAAAIRALAQLVVLAKKGYRHYNRDTVVKKLARHPSSRMEAQIKKAKMLNLMIRPELDCLLALVKLHDWGKTSPKLAKYMEDYEG